MSGAAHGMFSDLGSALRLLRETAGLTQAELARRAGLGKSQLSKYENGKDEILMASRLLQSPNTSQTPPRS